MVSTDEAIVSYHLYSVWDCTNINPYQIFHNIMYIDDEKTKQMAKVDGGYMLISSLFATLLAFGIKPDQAMGYSAIFCLPLFLTVLDLVVVDEIFGVSTKVWTLLLYVFIGASVYGMLG